MKFAEANNMKLSEFVKLLESRLPKDFTLIDN